MTDPTAPAATASSSKPAITLDQAVICRGGLALTAPLNLRFEAGSVTLIQGPNGVGKTSLLRVLAGLLPVMGGDVSETLSSDQTKAVMPFEPVWLTMVGWLPVTPGLPPGLNSAEILNQMARLHGPVGNQVVTAQLDKWGLAELADLPTQYLSAGQRRRVDLARLCLNPKPVWLLDEPAVTLDSQGREILGQAIEQHCQAGGLIVMASHEDWPQDHWNRIQLNQPAQVGGQAA
ncbi:MAG: heme ABC exporter ATP-binding protein CcmA [Alphaproteobacteria bacterium]|nr:heme ABC exporter ATP-binding protein CcmA [Alphaproteobacteria bacterium SS10]